VCDFIISDGSSNAVVITEIGLFAANGGRAIASEVRGESFACRDEKIWKFYALIR
jgi:hypothetical protein